MDIGGRGREVVCTLSTSRSDVLDVEDVRRGQAHRAVEQAGRSSQEWRMAASVNARRPGEP
jgi:hypothetical protein